MTRLIDEPRRALGVIFAATLICVSGLFSSTEHGRCFGDPPQVIATVPVGTFPRGIALTPDGTRVYVVNSGPQGDPQTVGTISVIDTATNAVVDTIPLGIGFPLELVFTPDGGTAYVPISKYSGGTITIGTDRVAVVDTAAGAVVTTIPLPGGTSTGTGPVGVVITPDGSRIYVTKRCVGSVAVIDRHSNSVVGGIGVGDTPVGIAITPDGNTVYVANRSTRQVRVIDTVTDTVVDTINMPPGVGPSTSSTCIAVSSDGTRAYVTYSESDNIAVIDIATNDVVDVVPASAGGLEEIELSPDGTTAYVAHCGADAVEVVDTNTCAVADTIGVGDGPWGLAVMSRGSEVLRLYVSNGASNDVSVIELAPSVRSVSLDIKPGSCPNPLNLKSKGVLPVAILGSEDFDVNDVDAASVRLADVAPIRSSPEDVAAPVADSNECDCSEEGADGFADLTLKFKTVEIVEQLVFAAGDLADGDILELTLTGELQDGTPIEGSDCMVLVGKVPEWIAAKRADIDANGKVSLSDLFELKQQWGKSSIPED